ncbi:TRAP transporter small permease [Ramlibacter sp. RBP-2]|uniref:TRAP transporter small permease protein n=1 Tax=Ramlibacter lithotrophicus TaxID=2606681 RepID=A0A7X6DIN0_9BURK|nr:TRAP transporter small permease [Ramlibacter lithotrophicus]NKE67830.1 TRAP transporter small permease [Ramlibacter lithotrophicus]
MTARPPRAPSAWRRFTAGFAALLNWLLIGTVAVLIVPVTMQIVSRYTSLIPPYIWTEELARFLFIWMIMLGAMIGVRESAHFDVDVWPKLGRGANAALNLVTNVCTLVFALVFVVAGIEFTQFAIYRISELAELPLWVIHIAWPLTGLAWIVFLGEQFVDNARILAGRPAQ